MTYNTLFSQAQITYVLVAPGREGSSRFVSSLCAWKNPSSGQPCHLLAAHCLTFSPPIHHNTAHRALLPEPVQSTSSANEPTALARQLRVCGKPAQHLSPQVNEPKETCDNFWKSFGRHLSLIRCTKRIWRTRSTSSNYWRREGIWTNPGTELTRSRDGRNVTCWEDVQMSLPPVPDALRRVCGKHCGLWSRKWRDTKVAEFTTVCPKSFGETRCNGRSGERGKCTNVSFIRWSESFRETGCIVFTKT